MSEVISGLLGVLVGSLIPIGREIWLAYYKRRFDGSYSAIRLICILEEYADACIDVVGDDGTVLGQPAGIDDSGQYMYWTQVEPPSPPAYPEDIAWRTFEGTRKLRLMHRILALPTTARNTNHQIEIVGKFSDPPEFTEFFAERREGYARIGLEALNLADELRDLFGIQTTIRVLPTFDWSPKEHLKKTVEKYDKLRGQDLI